MRISKKELDMLTQCTDITSIVPDELLKLFRSDQQINDFMPEARAEADPRSEEITIFNSRRAVRPADNSSVGKSSGANCVICSGRTTGIIDIKELSSGYTFINKNMFPVFYPFEEDGKKPAASGFHFLQWTSSNHGDDWTNMSNGDLALVLGRAAVLEGMLLSKAELFFPAEKRGWVTIIKNYGKKVGGSLEHDHQQIGFSSVMPGTARKNLDFYRRRGSKFNIFMLESNPETLLLKDYGPAQLIVPRFMKRPLNMMLLLKDPVKDFLYELTDDELSAVASGWTDAVSALMWAMPGIGREPAYNVITSTGAGIYFEFLPFTQEYGGFEHQGLFPCQMTPAQASRILISEIDKRKRAGQ